MIKQDLSLVQHQYNPIHNTFEARKSTDYGVIKNKEQQYFDSPHTYGAKRRNSLNEEMPIEFAETKISPTGNYNQSFELEFKAAKDLRETDPNLYEAERYQNRLKLSELKMSKHYDKLNDNYQQLENVRRDKEIKEHQDAKMRQEFMNQML